MNKNTLKAFNHDEIEKYQNKYKKEIENNYGESNAYKESVKKTSKYSKEDWKAITEEANNIYEDLAKVMDKTPDNEEAQIIIERWRNHITNNYYNCTIDIFRGLALMYVADERFIQNIDKHKVGLTKFMSSAMEIYCDERI